MNSTIRAIRARELVRGHAKRATESMTTNLQGGNIRVRLVAMWCFITAMLLIVFSGSSQKNFVRGRSRLPISFMVAES